VRLGQPRLEQAAVAGVGLEPGVEEVAHEGNGAEDRVDAEIAEHAREHGAGRTQPVGDEERVGAHRAEQDVAGTGNEADDGVEPDAEPERKPDRLVHQPGEVAIAREMRLARGGWWSGRHAGTSGRAPSGARLDADRSRGHIA
jgi:hypothetical protein